MKHKNIQRIILTARRIHQRVKKLADEISLDYRGKEVVVVSILKGSVIFCADLVRHIEIPCALDFMSVSSYSGDTSLGSVKMLSDIRSNPQGKHLLLIEDIADTGTTLSFVQENLKKRGAASVKTCVLLDKPDRRKVPVEIHYRGFVVPDEFVVGYGLDFEEEYRSLPYIGTLKPRKKGCGRQRLSEQQKNARIHDCGTLRNERGIVPGKRGG